MIALALILIVSSVVSMAVGAIVIVCWTAIERQRARARKQAVEWAGELLAEAHEARDRRLMRPRVEVEEEPRVYH